MVHIPAPAASFPEHLDMQITGDTAGTVSSSKLERVDETVQASQQIETKTSDYIEAAPINSVFASRVVSKSSIPNTAASVSEVPKNETWDLTEIAGSGTTPPLEPSLPFTTVTVLFGTDREVASNSPTGPIYGNDHAPAVSYGSCDVSIPRDHKMGQLENGGVLRFIRNDPTQGIFVLKIAAIDKASFLTEVSERSAASTSANALVFIHGYNNSFVDAARRTAQMAYDLGFPGAPIFFAWPSQDNAVDYPADENTIIWAKYDIENFLIDLAKKTSAKNIYVIAHSMGNRATLDAMTDIAAMEPSLAPRFRWVLLAAPDVDASTFVRDIAPKLIQSKIPITVYSSTTDYVLKLSAKYNKSQRLGEVRPPVIVQGIESVDASEIDTDLDRHAYVFENRSIISDIYYIVTTNAPAKLRFSLEAVRSHGGEYWEFKR
jgi:esterase/lipase superfamily enzyme